MEALNLSVVDLLVETFIFQSSSVKLFKVTISKNIFLEGDSESVVIN